MKPIGLIYCFTNLVNGKVYIGKTVSIGRFLRGSYRGSSPGHAPYGRARKKYGDHNFEGSILEWVYDDLESAEIWHIANKREELGRSMVYNIVDGGQGGNTNNYLKTQWQNPEFAKHVSEHQLALWSNPDHVAMRIERMKKSHADPRVKASKSKRMTELWNDSAKREQNRQKNKEYWNNPDNIRNTCPHCGKVGLGPIMKRWHYDKCKSLNLKIH